jgi:hypothetical protein
MKPISYSSVAGRPAVPVWVANKTTTQPHRRTLQFLIAAIKRT